MRCLIFLCLLLGAMPGFALDRSQVEGYLLPNGLQVLLFPEPSRPTMTVNLTYKVGSRHEGPGEAGMAHLLEHLLFKGTPTHKTVWAEFEKRGLRANGISAGPIKTLAASGIKGFGKILSVVAEASPIRRNVTIEDVGNVAAFLLSDLASGVTAEITYVDGGFSQTAGLSADQV